MSCVLFHPLHPHLSTSSLFSLSLPLTLVHQPLSSSSLKTKRDKGWIFPPEVMPGWATVGRWVPSSFTFSAREGEGDFFFCARRKSQGREMGRGNGEKICGEDTGGWVEEKGEQKKIEWRRKKKKKKEKRRS